jgi:hypothetical protein
MSPGPFQTATVSWMGYTKAEREDVCAEEDNIDSLSKFSYTHRDAALCVSIQCVIK